MELTVEAFTIHNSVDHNWMCVGHKKNMQAEL